MLPHSLCTPCCRVVRRQQSIGSAAGCITGPVHSPHRQHSNVHNQDSSGGLHCDCPLMLQASAEACCVQVPPDMLVLDACWSPSITGQPGTSLLATIRTDPSSEAMSIHSSDLQILHCLDMLPDYCCWAPDGSAAAFLSGTDPPGLLWTPPGSQDSSAAVGGRQALQWVTDVGAVVLDWSWSSDSHLLLLAHFQQPAGQTAHIWQPGRGWLHCLRPPKRCITAAWKPRGPYVLLASQTELVVHHGITGTRLVHYALDFPRHVGWVAAPALVCAWSSLTAVWGAGAS